MKPLLFITYGGSDWTSREPFTDPNQREAYERLFVRAQAMGFETARGALPWFRNGAFRKAWMYTENGEWKKTRKQLRPTIILDKASLTFENLHIKRELARQFPVVNPWELELVADDKLLTAVTFSEISVQTRLVRNTEDLHKALDEMNEEEVVIKPRFGYGGSGVQILSVDEARQIKIESLSIVQPFINTEKGIPGLHEGIHDFRVVFVGHEPIAAYIRTPAPGTKLCNISQGGSLIEADVNAIPETLTPHIEHVRNTFGLFPYAIYSTDFFFDGNGQPHLVEVNSKPIIALPEQYRSVEEQLHIAFLEYLSKMV